METPTTPRSTLNPPVFYTSAALILALVLFTVLLQEEAQSLFNHVQQWIITNASWFYVLAVALILISVVFLAVSRYGDIKLGPDHSRPDYRNTTWFAMLFSAGMGIGLMFFGVAEPVMHFTTPPVGEPNTVQAAKEAMKLTFFHWGLHAWAIYAIVALILAFFSYRHGLPLTLRSALYPLIGERIYGPIGHAVDIFAIIGTVFGVATSLGYGVLQINSGLHHLFGWPVNQTVQIALIAATCGLATLSVASGLDRGIRILSELNLSLAVILLLFVLVLGPTVFLLQTYVQNTGAYLSDIVNKTFNLYAYEPTDWIGGWTLLYWGWWLSWSPFVGLFIARISRGRTIREFVCGVLFVPAGFTLLWMTVFGDTAIHMVLQEGFTQLAEVVNQDSSVALAWPTAAASASAASIPLAKVMAGSFGRLEGSSVPCRSRQATTNDPSANPAPGPATAATCNVASAPGVVRRRHASRSTTGRRIAATSARRKSRNRWKRSCPLRARGQTR